LPPDRQQTQVAATDPSLNPVLMEWAEPAKDWSDRWQIYRWEVPEHTALAELADVANRLSKTWTWRTADSVVFILTGEEPQLLSITGRATYRRGSSLGGAIWYDMTTRVTVGVEPCVTPEELAAWWRDVRSRILTERYRPQTLKHIALATFLANHLGSGTWDSDRREWNRQFPEWQYDDSNRRNFVRDVQAAVRGLLHVQYRLGVAKSDATTESL
jgi:hypothetical protein